MCRTRSVGDVTIGAALWPEALSAAVDDAAVGQLNARPDHRKLAHRGVASNLHSGRDDRAAEPCSRADAAAVKHGRGLDHGASFNDNIIAERSAGTNRRAGSDRAALTQYSRPNETAVDLTAIADS